MTTKKELWMQYIEQQQLQLQPIEVEDRNTLRLLELEKMFHIQEDFSSEVELPSRSPMLIFS